MRAARLGRSAHPLAGQTVTLRCAPDPDRLDGQAFQIEDWWENVSGGSWMDAVGNLACLKYAMRSAFANLPTDNEVVYGKVGGLGHLIHVSELGAPVEEPRS